MTCIHLQHQNSILTELSVDGNCATAILSDLTPPLIRSSILQINECYLIKLLIHLLRFIHHVTDSKTTKRQFWVISQKK